MKRKILPRYLLILSFFTLFFIGIYGLNLFKLKRVYVIATKKINYGLGILNEENLLFLSNETISHYLLQQNIEIKSVNIRKNYPNSLIINITFRDPMAIISNDFAQLYYLDNEGVLLSSDSNYPDNLPKIEVGNIHLISGIKPDWRVVKIIDHIDNLKRENVSVNEVVVDDIKLVFHIYLPEGIEVIVPQMSDPSFIAASLQIITSRFRIEGKKITMIDFRYEKPIIIFSNGEKISSKL